MMDAVYHDAKACLSELCRVERCDKAVFRRGLCRAHHARLERYGDPLGGRKYEAKSPLREALDILSAENIEDLTLDELTVLSPQNDPYRLDTPVHHRNGQWLRLQMEACGLIRPDGYFASQIHNRGIHYAIFSNGAIRPDGEKFKNDDKGWEFLEKASKAARWLGYVPFEAIFDARNSPPVIRLKEERTTLLYPFAGVDGLSSELTEALKAVRFTPYVHAQFEEPDQPYRLVFWGEKTSLEAVLEPLSAHYDTDLYLPSGEISDSMLHKMAQVGAEDGREMVVFVFADCDPSGYQMAVSIGHKLRSLRDAQLFPDLKFRLIAPCLTVTQVKELGLPSTPLKDGEKRAWREKYGTDQTEIDALATLQPDTLGRIVHEAVAPYFDSTIASRVSEARKKWYAEAEPAFEAALDKSDFEKERAKAQKQVKDLVNRLHNRHDALRSMVRELCPKLPPIKVPEIELDKPPDPLVSSKMSLLDHINVMKDRKDYTNE